jgi:hypothetical protein
VIGIYLVKAIQDDRQREADKARHPSTQFRSTAKWWLQ